MNEEPHISDLTYMLRPEETRRIAADIESGHTHQGPFYLEIHITDCCNADCYFCNQRWIKTEKQELGLADFKQIISRLVREGLRAVRFSGSGEPTTHPHIKEMLDAVSESGLTLTRFDTNGILLSEDISRRLVKCSLKQLHISLQAPTPQSWALVTKHEPSRFGVVLQNIRHFIAVDRDRMTGVYASFIVDEPTFDKLDSMISLCRELDIQYRIHDLNAYTYSRRFIDECLPALKDSLAGLIMPANRHRFRFSHIPGLKPFTEGPFKWRQIADKPENLSCFVPWTGALIRANGNVYMCCALSEKKNIMGNVFEQEFMDIWRGSKFKSVREEAKAIFFKNIQVSAAAGKTGNQRYLCESYCMGCPVKTGMFSNPVLDTMIQSGSSGGGWINA